MKKLCKKWISVGNVLDKICFGAVYANSVEYIAGGGALSPLEGYNSL